MDKPPNGPDDESETEPRSLGRRAARGAQLALAGWVGSQAILFGAYIVLAHLVSPREFGRFVAGSLLITFGVLFAESGMMAALIRRRDGIEQAASSAFFSLVGTGLATSLLALAASPLIGLYFHSALTGRIAAALSGWLFLRAMTIVPDSLLQRRFSFARRVVIDPIGAVAFGAVAIIACAGGAGAWGLVAGTYGSEVLEVAAAWAFAGFRPRWRDASIATWRELAAFARPVLGSEILRRIASQLDVVTLGRFWGAATLGQYRNGLRLAQQPGQAFVDVGAYVLLPTLAHLSEHQDRLISAVRRVLGIAAAFSVPVSLASIPLGVPIAVLFLGARWRGAGHAIACLWGLLLGGAISSVAAESIKSVGRPELLIRMHAFGLAATAVLVAGGAIPFGLVGAATAVSVSQCLIGLYAYRLLTSVLSLRWRDLLHEMSAPVAAGGLMLLAMFGFAGAVDTLGHGEAAGLVLTLAEVTIGGLVYAVALLSLDRRRVGDLRALLGRTRLLAR